MIQCPKCKQGLPDWVQSCQFCGADTKSVARPQVVTTKRAAPAGQPSWIWPAYYAICLYFIVSGVAEIIQGVVGKEVSVFSIIVGSVMAIIGAGLAFRAEFIRGIANIYCWFVILSSGFGLLSSIFLGLILGPAILLIVAQQILNIICAVGMIFLIGETDDARRY